MPDISSKNRKFIKRNFKDLPIEELARQTDLKPNVIRSLIDEYSAEIPGKDYYTSRKATTDDYSGKKRSICILGVGALIIFSLTFLVYTSALNNDFVNWDDDVCIYENVHIRSLDTKSLYWMLTSFQAGNWHPLTWLSHALVYSLWALNPRMHHLINIIIHSLNTLLVFFLAIKLMSLWRITADHTFSTRTQISPLPQDLIVGGATALLFGLHPLSVESVAWVTERKGILCAFFVLLSLLSYLTYTSIHKKKRLIWFSITLLLFIFALLSKPMAVTLPVILLLLDIYPLKRANRYPRGNLIVFLEKIPFFILSIASGIVTIIAQRSVGAMLSLQVTNLTTRMLNALEALVFYIKKLIWPYELIPLYPFTGNLFNIQSVVSGMLVLVISGFSFEMARRRKPLFLIVWLYYVITLLPTLSIIQIGGHAAADRFTYLPRLSILLLVGISVSWLWVKATLSKFKELIRGLLLGCACVIIFLFSHLTIQQIRVWQNPEALWSYVIKTSPKRVPLPYNNLGLAYLEKGMVDEAIYEYEKALTINPNYIKAHFNLAVAFSIKGRLDETISEYKKLLAINPNFVEAHYNLGNAYSKKGRLDEAIAEFKRTLTINPNHAKAHYNLGNAYLKKDRLDEAIAEYKRTLTINPNHAKAHCNLGTAYYHKMKYKLAIVHCNKAAELGYNVNPKLLELLKSYR